MKLRTWLQGAGVAVLVLFPFYRNLINIPVDLRMHTPASAAAASVALSLVVNLILMSALFTLLGTWLQNKPGWRWHTLVFPAFIFASIAEIIYITRMKWESTHFWISILLIIFCLSVVFHRLWPQGEKILTQLSDAALIGLGFFSIIVILQLVHMAMWHQQPNSISQPIPVTADNSTRPRIVWILFDELSYQQVFETRYPNLELPNFDEFRKAATLFTNVQPLIDETEKAIPSILVGQNVVREDYTSTNQLKIGGPTGKLHAFDAAQTPFAQARQYGLTTGVTGWYNPYCVLLASYLNQCYWTDEMLIPSVFSQEGFVQQLLNPWILYGTIFRHSIRMLSNSYRASVVRNLMSPEGIRDHGSLYEDLMHHADLMLSSSGLDFVFLHLPLPHPPGFYDRTTGKFDITETRSYIDNLALTDKTLGHLLNILKKSSRWKNTSIVVCGDHSWRVYSWSHIKGWTPEDEAASHGRIFDPRPMLMVHLAGQTTPATVNESFPLLKVHDILDDLVQGKQPIFPLASASH